jgi:hypothetical protein
MFSSKFFDALPRDQNTLAWSIFSPECEFWDIFTESGTFFWVNGLLGWIDLAAK